MQLMEWKTTIFAMDTWTLPETDLHLLNLDHILLSLDRPNRFHVVCHNMTTTDMHHYHFQVAKSHLSLISSVSIDVDTACLDKHLQGMQLNLSNFAILKCGLCFPKLFYLFLNIFIK